ncbi:exported hypothetical protein [Desulfamplus magnetovallimortis]|uniref:LamG-like jellyroll fold domain-containing protein n=1 Tax=Desulfamplus magnetovallimortis TaxID=1246637 RepID=A0A1W1H682_9BACT|nr:LamG-like jellyroll fold domain-containing protein [Desulfamplus magnetovallimortis]SLM27878.1 exported hypothetical protein [Desulfamplus magnetovallimortis]
MIKQILIIAIALLTLASVAHATNYALNFDGTDDYVDCSSINLSGSTLTLECWINPDDFDTPVEGCINLIGTESSGNSAFLRLGDGGANMQKVQFVLEISGQKKLWSSTDLSEGTWYHIAGVYDSSTGMKIYINGVLDTNNTQTGDFDSNSTFLIGNATNLNRGYDGQMDEVRVWNIARTEAEIKANMHKELTGSETGLITYYKMSDGSGTTITDNSGNSNTGTITNGATWKASASFAGPRKALDFDGTDDYVTIADNNSLDLTTNYTIEAWIKPRAFNFHGGIVGKWHTSSLPPPYGYTLRLSGDISYSGINFDGMETEDGTLTANQWQHIAAVNNGVTRKVYLNGVEQTLSPSTPYTVEANSDPVIIGKDYLSEAGTRYFDGEIDEVRIWNVARTPEQIRENMMNTLNVSSELNLVAYYRMDQSDGTTLYDMTVNANNGTLTNMDNTDWVDSTAFNTWIGSESSDWSTAGNWSKNSAPASTDNVGLYKLSSLANEATISGTPTVNSLYFSSGAAPTLSSGFAVNGNLLLGKDISMSSNTFTLGSSANLVEGSYRLFGAGNITTTRDLNNITAENVAGLGAVLTTSANLGSTTITRAHTAQTISGNPSILRYYDITPTTNTGLNATLVFNYNDSELNGLTEADLKLWKSTDGGTNWIVSGGTIDTANNTITVTGQDGFSRWRAAVPNPATYNTTISTSASSNGSWSSDGGTDTWTPYATGATVSVSEIQNKLNADTSVVITTGSGAGEDGDVTISSAISKTAGGEATLTIKAARSIILNSNQSIASSNGTLNTILWADSDNNEEGSIFLDTNATINSNDGNITLGGGSDPISDAAMGKNTTSLDGDPLTVGVYLQTGSQINAGGGNISVRGKGGTSTNKTGNNRGITLKGTIQSSGNGTITIYGEGGATDGAWGIATSGSTIEAESGAINITGIGGTANTHGIGTFSGIIQSSSGLITLTGDGNGTGSDLRLGGANVKVGKGLLGSSSSNITLIADSLSMDDSTTAARIESTGNLEIHPRTASATIGISGATGTLGLPGYYFSGTNANFVDGFSSITIGRSSQTGDISIAATTVNDPLVLSTQGSVTQSGAITGGQNLSLQGTGGQYDLTNTGNVVSNLTADTGTVNFVNSGALTLATVSATGPVDIATQSGNLTLTGAILTANTSTNAVKLNAGRSENIGTTTGGDIIVIGGSVAAGSGGTSKLYTGSVSGSTGITGLPNYSSSLVHYNSDETSSLTFGAGLYVVYRETKTHNVTTYAELADAVTNSSSGDTISITADITVTSTISCTKNLVFDGNGNTLSVPTPGLTDSGDVNDSPSTFGVFSISGAGVYAEIKNMTIKGGHASGGGINVGTGATLRVENCLINNGSGNVKGGAINNSGTTYVYDCGIMRNIAQYGGGFVNNSGATMFIENCFISQNRAFSATGGGGAGENQGTLYINNSTIYNNNGKEIGGGINNYQGTLWVTNSTFAGNVAYGNYNGGAIGVNGGTATVINSLFAYNYRKSAGTVDNPSGFSLDDVTKYNSNGTINSYYNVFHGAITGHDVSSHNITYGGLADGSDNYLFSGGIYDFIINNDNLQIGTAKVFQPFFVEVNSVANTANRAVTLKTGSALLSNNYSGTDYEGTDTGYDSSNSASVIIGYYNKDTSSWVDLQGTGASSHVVTTDQFGDDRTTFNVRGAVAEAIDSFYMLKVNAVANGSVSGGSPFGELYASGSNITITATPDSGYEFTRWEDDLGTPLSTDNPYTLTVTSTLAVVPIFSTAAPSVEKSALMFDGTDDYVEFGTNSPPYSDTITIEAWIKTTSTSLVNNIVCWGYTHTTYTDNVQFRTCGGKLEFGIDPYGVGWVATISNTSVNSGNWTHVAVVKNGTSVKLYINGQEDVSGYNDRTPSVDRMLIGKYYFDENYFEGSIDEVRIWNIARTETQISDNMYSELTGSESGLVAYYKINEGSATSLGDSTTNSYTGTLATSPNNPTWIEGSSYGLSFDGTGDYVDCGNDSSLQLSGNITVEAWIKLSVLGQYQYLVSKYYHGAANGGYELLITNTNVPWFIIGNNDSSWNAAASTEALEANRWYHLAATYDGSTIKIYVDGVLKASQSQTGIVDSGTSLTIGSRAGSGFFSGAMDEVRVWSVVRSQNEIQDYMERTLAGNETGLVAYYKMNTGSGTTLTNNSINTSGLNNGTLLDNTTWIETYLFLPSQPQNSVVTGTARYWSGGGDVDPATISVNFNDTATLTITPGTGSSISTITGCGGTPITGPIAVATTYTTGNITEDCTVTATFTLNSYTVTGTADTGGTISPGSRTLNYNDTTTFTIIPDWGYQFNNFTGGCPAGTWSGNTYTTGAITADCTLNATFTPKTYKVTSLATANGTISPAGDQYISHGGSATFTVTPDSGYMINYVLGCNGTLAGTTYTTGAITGPCKVMAFFKSQ